MLTTTTVVKLTAKGQMHSPRGGNLSNHLSWQGVQQALTAGKGTATVAQVIAAVQAANPNNTGNAIGYTKYALRSGWLTTVAAPKAKAPAKAAK